MDDMNRENYDGGSQDAVPGMMEEVYGADSEQEYQAEPPRSEEDAPKPEENIPLNDTAPSLDEDATYPDKSDASGEAPSYSEENIAAGETSNQGGTYNPGGAFNRGGTYNSGGAFNQGGTYNQGNASNQSGNYNPGGALGQSGAYNPGGASNQGGAYHPTGAPGRHGAYPRHGAYGQNGPGNRYVPHGGNEARKKAYSSRYDSYRFETPLSPTSPGPENEDGEMKKKRSENVRKKKAAGGNSTAKKAGLVAGLAVLFGLVASLVFLGVTSIANKKVTTPAQNEENTIKAIPTPTIEFGKNESEKDEDLPGRTVGTPDTDAEVTELTVPQVVELCMPSMVAITNTTMEEYWDFFGGRSKQESVSAGSGIIVGETETELLIATNNHVVQNSTDITVTFIDDEAITGSIKGMDSDNDLAILSVSLDQIPQDTRDAIRVITIGDSDSMKVGESVVAIGNALGYGQSVSAGIISALGREVKIDGQAHALIQTDASINPGNSGGALINMRGELIGINEVKYVDETVEGVGYAIPMSTAKPILGSLGSKASRQKVSDDEASYIGIKCLDVPSYYVQSGYPSGVYVSEVTKGGPADAAGLKEGDIITAIDGIGVTSSSQLVNYLQYYAAGETIDFSVSRLNKDNTAFDSSKMPITLGSKKEAGLLENNGSEEPASPQEGANEKPAGPKEGTNEAPAGQGNEEPAESPSEDQGEDASGADSVMEEGEASEDSGWKIGDGGFPFLPEAGNW
ncbi:MAG: trypsin-like peptidase domain-containing protein [Lachnospiraceae bacterium]|nr:trypsin-like peptidase domain-containing protein [Lachnospiraceae bacterium]